VLGFAAPFTKLSASANCVQMLGQKPFLLAFFTFFIQLFVAGSLTTGGVALV
jgi:hypothetical protein